ncbi:biotin carboxylase N-terminal domain-containing protein [Sorangium sp. So ce381]|uniref:biotin carboxylase N-terminal domain-containing protein n=1 Tax=Sorangium sp. So ce381 TaxID=3133307 RepID=UPI003F5C9A00
MRKVLLSCGGEIAVRVLRSLHEAGLRRIAVCSDADRDGLHVRLASASYAIGPAPASESYLRFGRIPCVTRRSEAGAIHFGYGKPRVRGSMRGERTSSGSSLPRRDCLDCPRRSRPPSPARPLPQPLPWERDRPHARPATRRDTSQRVPSATRRGRPR